MLKGTAGSEGRRVGSSVNPGTKAGRSEGACVCVCARVKAKEFEVRKVCQGSWRALRYSLRSWSGLGSIVSGTLPKGSE